MASSKNVAPTSTPADGLVSEVAPNRRPRGLVCGGEDPAAIPWSPPWQRHPLPLSPRRGQVRERRPPWSRGGDDPRGYPVASSVAAGRASPPGRGGVRNDIPNGRPRGLLVHGGRRPPRPSRDPMASSTVVASASPPPDVLVREARPLRTSGLTSGGEDPCGHPVASSAAAAPLPLPHRGQSATTSPAAVREALSTEATSPAAVPWKCLRRRPPALLSPLQSRPQ